MSIYQKKGYQLQIAATCEALEQISVGGVRGNETAGEIMKSIMEGVIVVLVSYNGTDELYALWKEVVSPREIIPFQFLINWAKTEKELEDREKIKLTQYLPAVLKVIALKINNFQEWKEGDDELKQAMDLFKEKYNLSMKFINNHKETQTEMENNSDLALTETLNRPMIVKNKKDAPSSTRQYQCRYGCMAVFSKKNDLFHHQKETNRACKNGNANQLPVKRLPRSELTLLDMILDTINKISDNHLIPILPEDAMAICIAILKGIKKYDESMYESAMNAILGKVDL